MPSRCAVICWACQRAFSLSFALAAASRPASLRLRSLGAWTAMAAIASRGGSGSGGAPSVSWLMEEMMATSPPPLVSLASGCAGAVAAGRRDLAAVGGPDLDRDLEAALREPAQVDGRGQPLALHGLEALAVELHGRAHDARALRRAQPDPELPAAHALLRGGQAQDVVGLELRRLRHRRRAGGRGHLAAARRRGGAARSGRRGRGGGRGGSGSAPGSLQTPSPLGVVPASTRRPMTSTSCSGMSVPRGQSEDHTESHSMASLRAATVGCVVNAPAPVNSWNGSASAVPSCFTRRPQISESAKPAPSCAHTTRC